jgi:uncharacterized protein (DUF2062 family)
VYLSCTAAATRLLAGSARVAAAVAVLAVLAVLAFCGGQALLAVAAVALAVGLPRRTVSSSSSRRRPNPLTVPLFSSRTGTAHRSSVMGEPRRAASREPFGRPT